jgi:hypothetical protein
VPEDLTDFLSSDLNVLGRFGLPQDLLADCEVPLLLWCEVLGDVLAAGTAEVCERSCHVHPYMDLPVGIGDHVKRLGSPHVSVVNAVGPALVGLLPAVCAAGTPEQRVSSRSAPLPSRRA